MVSNRRSSRSRRALAAAALLVSAVLVAIVGILVSTVPVLVGATAYAVVTGIVAARLLSNDLAQMRRDWAGDRAKLADEHRLAAVTRSREQAAYATQMGSRIRLREAQLSTLRDSLVTAEIDLARSRERLSAERARSEALESDLDSARSDLESARVDLRQASDALATSETAELQARAELLAWEEASSEEIRRLHARKLA
jgi:chromosome segregation ATPase